MTVKKGVASNHNAAYFIVSGSPGSLGIILGCSNNVYDTIGFYKEKVINQSANVVMPKFFADKHNHFIKTMQLASGSEVIHKPRNIEIQHKDGYLVSCAVDITVKFLQKHGLCYYVLVTPIIDEQRIVHLQPDGEILDYSRNFAEEIGLPVNDKTYLNICSLCPEIEQIINAFNYFSKKSPENTRLSKAIHKMARQSSQLQKSLLSSKVSFSIQQAGLNLNNSKIDVDGLTNLYKRYKVGDLIVFPIQHNDASQPMRLQRNGFEKEKRDIVYNMRIRMLHYGDNTLLKLNLIKIGKDDIHMDKQFIETLSGSPMSKSPNAKNNESNGIEDNSKFIASDLDDPIYKAKRGILKKFLQIENNRMTSAGIRNKNK